MSQSVAITTEDGTLGDRGRVTDVLPALLGRTGSDVVYACGPMGMLAAVADLASRFGAHSQCAVEEAMACGIGVCMTCVLPVVGDDGVTRMVALVRRRAGVSRRPCAMGRRGHRARRHLGCTCQRGEALMTRLTRVIAPETADRPLPDVDMSTDLAGVTLPNPSDDGFRVRGVRPRARPVLRHHGSGRCRDQVDHAATAVGAPDSPHGRDSQRDVELDRSSGTRDRAVRRARPQVARRTRRPRHRVDRRRGGRRVHPSCAAAQRTCRL